MVIALKNKTTGKEIYEEARWTTREGYNEFLNWVVGFVDKFDIAWWIVDEAITADLDDAVKVAILDLRTKKITYEWRRDE